MKEAMFSVFQFFNLVIWWDISRPFVGYSNGSLSNTKLKTVFSGVTNIQTEYHMSSLHATRVYTVWSRRKSEHKNPCGYSLSSKTVSIDHPSTPETTPTYFTEYVQQLEHRHHSDLGLHPRQVQCITATVNKPWDFLLLPLQHLASSWLPWTDL